ncbi:HAD family hydrolase [Acidicapsa acidisoli]|uniref:HAD family hydrolase n=1 Tax=Acidicapsa acidisoli TaxID=1615681 RepID=UPI0021DF558D|nr:HAD family hydrolase [Acidicapsa acidisoli]
MTNQLAKAAIVYDFDGTLARGNLQECSFIPKMNMTRTAFWDEVKRRTREEDADEILVYMHLMLEKAKMAGEVVTKQMLRKHGMGARLFSGLEEESWFIRMNKFAAEHGLQLQHYIVSSGIEEMIRGCSIQNAFHRIYASKYIYEGDVAAWPGVALNYTTKTQYLFRINKGVENHWDNAAINKFMSETSRPVPFKRMIFVGDGDTDIPAMKMVSHQGGHSIAVYDEQREKNDLEKIHRLISDGRVNFVAPANYERHSQMEIVVKGIIGRIARELN